MQKSKLKIFCIVVLVAILQSTLAWVPDRFLRIQHRAQAKQKEETNNGGSNGLIDRFLLITPITDPEMWYMNYYYNPFWYGGPVDGGELFDGPFGGFAANPFARPTAKPKAKKSKKA